MAVIEMLHTGWGLLAIWLAVRNGVTIRDALIGTTHGTVAGRWLALSGAFALIPIPLIRIMRHSETEAADWKSTATILAFSLLSAVTYAVVMRDYYIGRMRP
jgi:riboflavin transporter FmnP